MKLAAALLALGSVAGCAVSQTNVAGNPQSLGTVESAAVASLGASPSAGGTAGSATMAYRVQMADGTMRTVVQAGERFAVGDRVQVGADGRLARP